DPALRPQTAEEFRQLILEVPKHKGPLPAPLRDPLITPSEGVTVPSQSPTPPAQGASKPPVAVQAQAPAPSIPRNLVIAVAAVAARDRPEQATVLDPDHAEARYRLGGLFLNSQPDRARREYEAAKRLNATKYADVVDTILKGL